MFSAYGWCRIATARPPVLGTNESVLLDADAADEVLWTEFRQYMSDHETSFLKWQFYEHLNNDSGVLTFTDSANHRTSRVFGMFDWIAEHGKGSFGLMYVLDDEDKRSRFDGITEHTYTTVHRVHRLLEGQITEHEDPFFGVIAALS